MCIRPRNLLAFFACFIGSIILIGVGALPAEAQVTTLFQESFRNAQVDDLSVWTYGVTDRPTGAIPVYSDPPCLTAAPQVTPLPTFPAPPPNRAGTSVGLPSCPSDTKGLLGAPDAANTGVLRLTTASTPVPLDDKRRQGTFALFNSALNTSNGLNAEFDFFAYDGTGGGNTPPAAGTGADGISFFILDASQPSPITAGAVGGSLGYAQQIDANLPGIAGGYVGIGFDEFGQFSNPQNFGNPAIGERSGGPGQRPQSVVIRGATTANINTSNPFLIGVNAPQPISISSETNRNNARRRARITLTPAGVLAVQISYAGGPFVTVINNFDVAAAQGAPPAQIRFGFAASTGGQTNIHEIRDLVITTLPPDLSIQKISSQANVIAGQTYTYTLRVVNSIAAGPTIGAVEVFDSLPTGLNVTSATGPNWACTVTGQNIACTYTGGVLASGATAPDIVVTVTPTAGIQQTPITNTVSVTTPGDSDPSNNTATASVNLNSPRLSAQKSVADLGTPPPSSVNNVAEAGENVRFTITVRNDGNADSTNTQIIDPIPANTQYVPGTTTLNGVAIPDAAGPTMPFTTGGLVNDNTTATLGLIQPNQQAVVVYQVIVDNPLPGAVTRIENQAQVNSAELPPLPPLNTNLAVLPTRVGPNISLIKRIVRLVRSGVVLNFSSVEGNPPDQTFIGTINSSIQLTSGDEITYRVYAISDGSVIANNVQICDQIPTGSTYIANSIQLSTPPTNVGTALSAVTPRTDAFPGNDGANFAATPTGVLSPPCTNTANPNGSVLVEPFDLNRDQRTFLEFTTRLP